MAELTLPNVDFSILGQLPQIYRQGQMRAREDQALASLGQGGNVDPNALIQSGNLDLAKLGLNLKQQQEETARQAARDAIGDKRWNAEYALRQRQLTNNEDYTPEELDKRRVTQLTAAGADPASPAGQAYRISGEWNPAAGQPKPRNLSFSDVSKMSEEGGKLQQVNRFVDTFDSEYGGRPLVGEARNWVGRTLPSWAVDPKTAEGATWWQDYDKYKSVVRNELYGQALTPGERADFAKADINPGMNPDAIKRNLLIQQKIVRGAIERKVKGLISEGYSSETVQKSYGLDQQTAPSQSEKSAPSSTSNKTSTGVQWSVQ